jgi:hypothetical protein
LDLIILIKYNKITYIKSLLNQLVNNGEISKLNKTQALAGSSLVLTSPLMFKILKMIFGEISEITLLLKIKFKQPINGLKTNLHGRLKFQISNPFKVSHNSKLPLNSSN